MNYNTDVACLFSGLLLWNHMVCKCYAGSEGNLYLNKSWDTDWGLVLLVLGDWNCCVLFGFLWLYRQQFGGL